MIIRLTNFWCSSYFFIVALCAPFWVEPRFVVVHTALSYIFLAMYVMISTLCRRPFPLPSVSLACMFFFDARSVYSLTHKKKMSPRSFRSLCTRLFSFWIHHSSSSPFALCIPFLASSTLYFARTSSTICPHSSFGCGAASLGHKCRALLCCVCRDALVPTSTGVVMNWKNGTEEKLGIVQSTTKSGLRLQSIPLCQRRLLWAPRPNESS